jgi:TPR repeat protein
VEWYRKAAAQGHATAQSNLGACYDQGEGVRKDADKAVEWLRKAADQGDAQAQQVMMDLGLELHTPDAQGGAE